MSSSAPPPPILVSGNPVSYKTGNIMALAALPVVRTAILRTFKKYKAGRSSREEAHMAQERGEILSGLDACSDCLKGKGPHEECVVVASLFGGSCANCHYASKGHRCSLRGEGQVLDRRIRSPSPSRDEYLGSRDNTRGAVNPNHRGLPNARGRETGLPGAIEAAEVKGREDSLTEAQNGNEAETEKEDDRGNVEKQASEGLRGAKRQASSGYLRSLPICLTVGQDSSIVKLWAHKDALLDANPAFLTLLDALGPRYIDGSGLLNFSLPEESPEIMEAILHWTVYGELLDLAHTEPLELDRLMIQLHDKSIHFGMAECAEAVLRDMSSRKGGDAGASRESNENSAKMLSFVYRHARPDSKMRMFFIKEVLEMDLDILEKYKAEWPIAIWQDLTFAAILKANSR